MFSLLLIGLSAQASPYGSDPASVIFHDRVDAFNDVEREVERSTGGSWGSLGVRIALESRGYTDTLIPATSELEWPEPLSQTFIGAAGHHEVNVNLTVVAQITFSIFGVPGSYDVWSRSLELSARRDFHGLLLPGSSPSSVTAEDGGSVLASYSTEWPVGDEVYVWFDIDLAPRVTSSFSGHRIESGDAFFTHDDEVAVHPVPALSPRSLDLDTGYVGQLDSSLDAVVSPWVTVCYYGFGWPACYDIDTDIPVNLVTLFDEREFGKGYLGFPLPILRIDQPGHYFGELYVGETESHQIPITNNGDLDLEVRVESDGHEAFGILDDLLVVRARETGFIRVDYSPREPGTHSSELILISNDPERPEVSFLLSGQAEEPPEPEPEPEPEPDDPGSDTSNFAGDSEVDFGGRACGCSTASPSSGLVLALFVGVMALLGRRRRMDTGRSRGYL